MSNFLLILICLLCLPPVCVPARAVSPGAEFELIDGAYWHYDDYDKQFLVRYPGDERDWEICGMWASAPVASPDRAKLAFLDPWEFEETSWVHVYDVATRELAMLFLRERGRQEMPMQIVWLDNDTLLLTVGHVYGTVSFGGDLHYYDLKTNRNAKIVTAQAVQITDAAIDGDTARLTILEYSPYYFKIANYMFSPGPFIYSIDMPVARLRELMAQKQTDSVAARPKIAATSALWCISTWLYGRVLANAGMDALAILRKKN